MLAIRGDDYGVDRRVKPGNDDKKKILAPPRLTLELGANHVELFEIAVGDTQLAAAALVVMKLHPHAEMVRKLFLTISA